MRLDQLAALNYNDSQTVRQVVNKLDTIGKEFVHLNPGEAAGVGVNTNVEQRTTGFFSRLRASFFIGTAERERNKSTLDAFRRMVDNLSGLGDDERSDLNAAITRHRDAGKPVSGRTLAELLRPKLMPAENRLRLTQNGYMVAKWHAEHLDAMKIMEETAEKPLLFNGDAISLEDAERLLPKIREKFLGHLFLSVNTRKRLPRQADVASAYRTAVSESYVEDNKDKIISQARAAKLSPEDSEQVYKDVFSSIKHRTTSPFLHTFRDPFDIADYTSRYTSGMIGRTYANRISPDVNQLLNDGLKPGGSLHSQVMAKLSAGLGSVPESALHSLSDPKNIGLLVKHLHEAVSKAARENPGCFTEVDGNGNRAFNSGEVGRMVDGLMADHFKNVDDCMAVIPETSALPPSVEVTSRDTDKIYEHLCTDFTRGMRPELMKAGLLVIDLGMDNFVDRLTNPEKDGHIRSALNSLALQRLAIFNSQVVDKGLRKDADDINVITRFGIFAGLSRHEDSSTSVRFLRRAGSESGFTAAMREFHADNEDFGNQSLSLDMCEALSLRFEQEGAAGMEWAAVLRALYEELKG